MLDTPEDDAEKKEPGNWYDDLFAAFHRSPGQSDDPVRSQDEPAVIDGDGAPGAIEAVRESLIAALIAAIRAVSNAHDREAIVRWFENAGATLKADKSTPEKAADLYKSVDSRRFASILANTVKTSLLNFKGASLPFALKVAVPVGVIGLPLVGMQGAGVAAFGSAIGLPVVLLLFLGSAGVASIVEPFVRDPSVRDPLTKLMMAFVAAEAARRIDKELLKAMRADAMVPQRADISGNHQKVLASLLSLDPIDFERHVMTFFEDEGYPVGVTAASNDYGIDGYVLHPDGLIIVQCKRYAPENLVGSPSMTQFWGTMGLKKAIKGYFVTTSGFTSQARNVASEHPGITLVDGAELVKWHVVGKRVS